jgi:hypothetical protein
MPSDSGVVRTGCAFLVAFAVLLPGEVEGARQRFEVEEESVIVGPSGQARVLMDFGDLAGLSGGWIASAHVAVDLSEADLTSDVELELYGVEESWAGRSPTWNWPWNEPGGDLDDWSGAEAFVARDRNGGPVRFDVTEIVRQLVSEDTWTEGFLLVARAPGREGLLPAELTRMGGSIPVELEVTFRRVSAPGNRSPRE